MKTIAIGGVVLILLAVAHAALPGVFHFLPLGGSTIAEMGIVFGLSIALATITEIRRFKDGKN